MNLKLLKNLVSFKNAKDRHRIVFTFQLNQYSPTGSGTKYPIRGQTSYEENTSRLTAYLNEQLPDGWQFITVDREYQDNNFWYVQYLIIIDVLTGTDAALIKLNPPEGFGVTAYKYVKPKRYPKENCTNQ